MRILIVSQWFQPEPHFKGLAFAKALQARGHDVEVLTGFPNYPGGKVYPGYRIKPFARETMDGVVVTRGYLHPSHDRSARGRIANYVSFALSSMLLAFTLRRPDVVYVYTPPMTAALAPVVLKLLRRVPFVCDIQDLWPDTLAATGMVDNRRILQLVGWWTNFALRRAARIVVLSDGFKRRLAERKIAAPIAVVPNWAPPEIAALAQSSSPPAIRNGEPFRILFAGNMGKAQGLGTVIDAACLLKKRGVDAEFVMIGGGVEVEQLREQAETLAPGAITFHPPRHPSRMGEMFEQADALLVHLRDDPLFEITIPSKMQAYLAMGKPILLGVKGDAAAMLARAGAGLSFTPQDPEALSNTIMSLMAMSPEDRARMGEAGSLFYREQLAFDIGVAAIEDQLRLATISER
ncbi:glycosyltransferase family 4 protein [Sphingomonas sp. XXL09]|uniref:glycosyltransferase family 4 protein n=1 Tax=Sphingomonas sp. XXL09 TaxID=3457787 RepID=UPI00406BBB1B